MESWFSLYVSCSLKTTQNGLVTFTEEILNGKLQFLCRKNYLSKTQKTLWHANKKMRRIQNARNFWRIWNMRMTCQILRILIFSVLITKWEEYKMQKVSEKYEICDWRYVLVFQKIVVLQKYSKNTLLVKLLTDKPI